ncbi:acetyl-CoA carboxylase biotin carboxyl carrier protein [Flavisphingomonas formosensis]|uniref:acetyl-CoA carboxylase biotin carboxyl carrier protein n=1 Tax=Flavisphingomonas formosensis TaxID=861534 RepID=UPI0012F75F64|nr:acetyl-CoA carboxylase biotin carboxyl carrier protein [Sphingomonas formosensis]
MSDKNGSAMQVDPDLVRQLATLLDDTRLTEIEVQDGDRRIRVVRNISVPAQTLSVAAAPVAAAPVAVAAPQAAPVEIASAEHPGAVKSPMVGTAYLAAEPGAKPFVQPGDKVAAGVTLLIVEAMKVMNPIVSPRGGTVKAVLVDNGQPVEYDQPLVIVE